MLTSDGQIYTFGSNSYGQLGLGDLSSRGSPTLVKIPSGVNIVMITAGSHHSAALTSEGDVLSWGAYAVNGFTLYFMLSAFIFHIFRVIDAVCFLLS